tara:strand:+ start:7955 stop:8236 length:282 start_codon:yes stop_codon:yes gene_type:complete
MLCFLCKRGERMKVKPGDTIKIKIPISKQWFIAHAIGVSGTTIKARTLFKYKGQDTWIVDAQNVIKQFQQNDTAMKESPSLQREIRKVTRGLK